MHMVRASATTGQKAHGHYARGVDCDKQCKRRQAAKTNHPQVGEDRSATVGLYEGDHPALPRVVLYASCAWTSRCQRSVPGPCPRASRSEFAGICDKFLHMRSGELVVALAVLHSVGTVHGFTGPILALHGAAGLPRTEVCIHGLCVFMCVSV